MASSSTYQAVDAVVSSNFSIYSASVSRARESARPDGSRLDNHSADPASERDLLLGAGKKAEKPFYRPRPLWYALNSRRSSVYGPFRHAFGRSERGAAKPFPRSRHLRFGLANIAPATRVSLPNAARVHPLGFVWTLGCGTASLYAHGCDWGIAFTNHIFRLVPFAIVASIVVSHAIARLARRTPQDITPPERLQDREADYNCH